MQEEDNFYQAPDTPIVEDFIAYERSPRPLSSFVAAVSCFAAAFFLALVMCFVIYETIDSWSKAGTRWENRPARLGWREVCLFTIGGSTLAMTLAGRAFWVRRDRRGLVMFLTSLGLFALTLVPPLFFH